MNIAPQVTVRVNETTQVIGVRVAGLPGPQGPAGAQGPAGEQGTPGSSSGGGLYFDHQQSTPASIWTINHNLGARPTVTIYTVGGVEVWAEVVHLSANQVQVLLDAPLAGFALCT